MKSKKSQLMLLAGALTVSFAAQAAVVQDNTRSENPIEETDKATDANLFGHVVDTKTGEHLPYVTIQLKGTTIGTTTDHTGHYFLKNLPEGTFTIVAKFLGYKTEEPTVTVQHNTTQEVNFSLSTDDVAIDEVVVSANRNETARRLAPNLVSVVGSKVFDITQSTCLAQGLNFQPGVRTEDNCQNCGFTQVRINGLDGHYSQILVDSRPVFSSLTGVYGLEQIPANMIDRVEVVRGGGSALFDRWHHQHHHQGAHPQLRLLWPHLPVAGRIKFVRQCDHGQCLSRHRRLQGRRLCLRPDAIPSGL